MNESPAHSESAATMDDWGQAFGGRQRPAQTEDWSRRRLAVIGILVAILFPFYQHAVQRELLSWELTEVQRFAEAALRDTTQANAESALAADAARAASRLRARIAAVRVVGVIDGNPPIVVVENVPPQGAAEVAETICTQASYELRRNLNGRTLRVTRDGGRRPGTDAGMVNCPGT